jgi:hypothetical protein
MGLLMSLKVGRPSDEVGSKGRGGLFVKSRK